MLHPFENLPGTLGRLTERFHLRRKRLLVKIAKVLHLISSLLQ